MFKFASNTLIKIAKGSGSSVKNQSAINANNFLSKVKAAFSGFSFAPVVA